MLLDGAAAYVMVKQFSIQLKTAAAHILNAIYRPAIATLGIFRDTIATDKGLVM